jgi:O-Antigen ligase
MATRVAIPPQKQVRSRGGELAGAAAAAVLAFLLLLATWFDGAFDLRYWAPLAVLGLAALVAAQVAGAVRIEPGPRLVAVAAFWGFAAWTLLSASWAESPSLAWEGACRTILYATLVTLAMAVPARRPSLWVGALMVAGAAAIAAITLIALYVDGPDLFVAGRLDDPVGYRNATAALFAFAFWPLIGVAATRRRNPVFRAAAFATAVLGLGLVFLTQSRGVVIGLVAGGLVSFAIGPDRVRRVWLALAAAGVVAAASSGLLEPYHAFQDGVKIGDAEVDGATTSLTIATVAAFAGALLVAILDNGLRLSDRWVTRISRFGTAALIAVAVVGAAGALVAIGNPVSYASDKWDEFTDLEPEGSTESIRLGSVGGQRYDLWRIALKEFESEPLTGVGESSYFFDYYDERRTDRNLSDPHSLPLRLLAETGIVGFLLFSAFLVAIAIAIARAARLGVPSERRAIAGLAAAGAVILGQFLTDWLWLFPTLTGLGLLALALAAAPPDPRPPQPTRTSSRRGPPWLPRFGAAAVLVAAAASVALLFLSDFYVREARSEAGRSPQAQLDAAERAEDLNPTSVTPLYLQASALETMGDRGAAREKLLEALDEEPNNFITLAVLGDLEIRAGRREVAARYYRRAAALNPRDVGLQELARTTAG